MRKIFLMVCCAVIVSIPHSTYAQTQATKKSSPLKEFLLGVANTLSNSQKSVFDRQRDAIKETYRAGELTKAEYANIMLDIDRNEAEYKKAASQAKYQQEMIKLKKIQLMQQQEMIKLKQRQLMSEN